MERPPDKRRRPPVFVAGAIAAVAIAVAAFLLLRGGSGPEATLERFADAYANGDYEAAAAETDGDADQVASVLAANAEGLDGAELEAEVEAVDEVDGEAEATLAYRWQVPEIGEFGYENPRVRMVEGEDGWRLRWSERAIHPRLGEGDRLGTVVLPPERGAILDRDGDRLVKPRPVVEIGVIPRELDDREAAIDAIASTTDAGRKSLRRSIEAAKPGNFVPAITVRQDEFRRVEDARDDVAVAVLVEDRPSGGEHAAPIAAEFLEGLG